MLAKNGWSVRVHERAEAIREAGAGIYLRDNSLNILEEYGLFDKLASRGTRILRSVSRDWDGTIRQQIDLSGAVRQFVVPRQALVDVWSDEARNSGVEIVLN